MPLHVLLLIVILTLAAAPSRADEVYLTHYLLDQLDETAIDVKAPRAGSLPSNRYFQPYYHSTAADEVRKYHARVIVREKTDGISDMRDALALPVPSSATFALPEGAGRFLLFSPLPLDLKRYSRSVVTTVVCLDRQRERILWQDEAQAMTPSRVPRWPDPVRLPVPDWCEAVRFAAEAGPDTKPGKLVIAWDRPRVEQPGDTLTQARYNVLFIVVDALRSDVVGTHRTAFPTVSPAIDELEASGTTFPNGFANGNTTLLSMNTMLLGTHPRALGFLTLRWAGTDRRQWFYDQRPPYLTLLLHRAGYVTYGATHNHLYFPGYKYGVDPGFDVLQDCSRDTRDHPILTDRTMRFMEENRHRRFLAQVNLIGPHQPYTPPPECRQRAKEALKGLELMYDPNYLGEVCWVDVHVRQLVEKLEELGLRESTIVVLTSDHGEVMDALHDCRSARDGRRCRYLHGLTLFDEEINVPIMFSLPGLVKSGQVTPDVAQHVDIVPTLLELLGIARDERMTGRSLAAVLTEGKRLEEVPVYAERWVARTLRTLKYKLIFHTRKDDVCPKVAAEVCKSRDWVELYDMENDPGERVELSRELPDVVKEMEAKLDAMRALFYQQSGGDGPNP